MIDIKGAFNSASKSLILKQIMKKMRKNGMVQVQEYHFVFWFRCSKKNLRYGPRNDLSVDGFDFGIINF